MAKTRPILLEFTRDRATESKLLDEYRTDDGRKLTDCSKEELGAMADKLCHVASLCLSLAEKK